jgi:amidase
MKLNPLTLSLAVVMSGLTLSAQAQEEEPPPVYTGPPPVSRFGSGPARLPFTPPSPDRFHLMETTAARLQAAMNSRLVSSEELVRMYLARIQAFDDNGPALNAYLSLNPQAEATARALDAARFLPGTRPGPLYGVPVALKDIVDTQDMPTTGGALGMKGSVPPTDAFITRKLRQAGAVILGKLTLTEFANFVTSGMPAGYSSLGGYGFNPYNPVALPGGDGRPLLSPSGSSSGSGIAAAANLAAMTIGTETSGSILSPANANGIVGIKPTVGLVSRDGIIPITADQDTAGPMTRSVADAAVLLGVIAGYDPADPATAACQVPGNCHSDYTPYLRADALKGARLLVPPFPANRAALMEAAIAKLEAAGATVVRRTTALPGVSAPGVLNYGQKRDVNAYLDRLPETWPIQSLADLIAFNTANAGIALKYGQTQFIASNALDISPGSANTLTYIANRDLGFAQSRGSIDGAMNGPDGLRGTADDFDAVVYSGSGSAGLWARAGYPSIVVPLGFVAQDGAQVPSGISFAGRAFGEPTLIALAYAFEQLAGGRLPPASTPPLATDTVVRGDLNGDRSVDSLDVALLGARLGETAKGAYDKADVNGDGRITGLDLNALRLLCSLPGCRRP